MKKQIITLFMALLLPFILPAQVTLKLGSIENAVPGTYINVPLIVSGLSSAGQAFTGIECYFDFQQGVIIYDSLANGNPLTPVNQWFAGSPGGNRVSANWLGDLTPINVDNNSVLIEFVFFYEGGQTTLTFDEGATIVYDSLYNPMVVSQFINGSVTQSSGSSTSVWNGNGTWSTNSNWSNSIPGDSTNAAIETGIVEVSNANVCNDLTINSGTKLIIHPGSSLSVNGTLNNSGDLLIESDSLIQGSLIVKNGIVQTGLAEMQQKVYPPYSSLVSSPVQSAAATVFPNGVVSAFQETINDWFPVSASTALVPGLGYRLTPGVNTTISYSGDFNTLSFPINLSYTSQGNSFIEGWNLVGNPYTSSFSSDDNLDFVNTDRTIYAWDGYKYRFWNGTTGNLNNGIIPPLSGFFVRANAANAQVIIKKEGRVHDFTHFGSTYTLPANVLQVNLNEFENEMFSDNTFIQEESNATNQYDGAFDALKLSNAPDYPEIYSLGSQGEHLAINAVPDLAEFWIGISIPYDGSYTISADVIGFEPGKPIFLVDEYLSITRDLRDVVSGNSYTFVTSAGDFTDRFKLVMTGVGMDELGQDPGFYVYSRDHRIYLNSLRNIGKSDICLYDALGRRRYSQQQDLDAGNTISMEGISGLNILSIRSPLVTKTIKVIIP